MKKFTTIMYTETTETGYTLDLKVRVDLPNPATLTGVITTPNGTIWETEIPKLKGRAQIEYLLEKGGRYEKI